MILAVAMCPKATHAQLIFSWVITIKLTDILDMLELACICDCYLCRKDRLVAGGTLGSKNPVMEETTGIRNWNIHSISLFTPGT